MSHSLLQAKGGSVAQPVSINKPSPLRPLALELREHLRQLRLILPVITNAVVTLRRQNADADADVAYDLTEEVCEPLDYEIERIETILVSHASPRLHREAEA
jgi:hypothetical protein